MEAKSKIACKRGSWLWGAVQKMSHIM